MKNMTVHHLSQPSSSKGWARYRITANGVPVLRSQTGNDWLSVGSGKVLLKPKTTDPIEPGTRVLLEVQVALREGARGAQTVYPISYCLVSGEGSTAIRYRPGSQGMEIRIDGATAEVAS